MSELLAAAEAALDSGDLDTARDAFDSALATAEGPALEGLSHVTYRSFEFNDSVAFLERAYAVYRDARDGPGAARVARQVAYMHGALLGDAAVMQGWLTRAKTLLDAEDASSERGWIALTAGMFDDDRSSKERCFVESIEVAKRFGDTDLEFVALAYYGASLVHSDRTEEGMVRLDEACAAVAGCDVTEFFLVEEIFCQLFSACERAHDIARADQWIKIGDEIAAKRNLPSVAAFCKTHYGGILTAAGRWHEADEALTEAARIWGLGWGTLRSGALIRLADLRVRQGRHEEAERLLDGYETYHEAAGTLAAIHLARGDVRLARDVLERALAQLEPDGSASGPLWAVLADVNITLGDIAAATEAVERSVAVAERHPTHHLRATAALARGRLCLVAGTGDAKTCLTEAISGFAKAQMPIDLATVRLELANALAADEPEVAIAEAQAALDAFGRLQAARHADAAAAVLRKLGGPSRTGPKGADPGALTRREAEVLELLALGLSNPDIGDRLFISRKTVEHHVGNVLAKLGLRSRAEAAAYVARTAQKTGE